MVAAKHPKETSSKSLLTSTRITGKIGNMIPSTIESAKPATPKPAPVAEKEETPK
jgi:hypothetical protein